MLMAVSSRLDRAGAVERIATLTRAHDVVILDRYARVQRRLSAARLHQDADGEMSVGVGEFEYDRLGLPVPDRQILLDVSVELAAQRARNRAGVRLARDAYPTRRRTRQRTGAAPLTGRRHWRGWR